MRHSDLSRESPAKLTFDLTSTDTALCGDWAGNAQVWATACKDTAPTCGDAMADPANFDEAVWEIAYVKVYSLS